MSTEQDKTIIWKKGKRCSVDFYTGYKGEETPRRVLAKNKIYIIDKILWRKRCKNPGLKESWETFGCLVGEKQAVLTVASSGESWFFFKEKGE
ncbi:MAG: hypothetical protein JXB26_04525 [Candidatus Aminicenantes bacterium]|nr:hypothetical protein [Candidatus Aminicenantes bacterium]